MDPPPITVTDSAASSPRSTTSDTVPFPSPKLRLMCSYGGHIVPRPHDKVLCYVGGDTRIVVVDRNSSLSDAVSRLSKLLLGGKSFSLKYQLPNEDLDSLITVSTDEDLENMIEEYDRLASATKPSRLRIFLFGTKSETAPASLKSEEWFVDALNNGGGGGGSTGTGLRRGVSDPNSVNCLLGLEEKVIENSDPKKLSEEEEEEERNCQDVVRSMPDSPMIETNSSFGSTSSSPSHHGNNLAPIRVSVEDGGGGGGGGGEGEVRVLDNRNVGIEDQFSQLGVEMMGVGIQVKQQDESGFVAMPVGGAVNVAVGVPVVGGAAGGGEYVNRVVSDDERSDQGYGKPPSVQQNVNVPVMVSSQSQQKIVGGDLASPDSVSSDSSLSSVLSRQKAMIYQESTGQVTSLGSRVTPNIVDAKAVNVSEPSILQHNSSSGYTLSSQYGLQQQQQQQLLHQQQQQDLLRQQQQQQQELLRQQQQQQLLQQQQSQPFIHAAPHYAHHTPAGAAPFSTYYPLYASQHPQLHPHQGQYPVFYIPAGQPQAYNYMDAANIVPSTRGQAPPNPTVMSASATYNPTRTLAPQKPEMAPGVYMKAAAAAPAIVQVPSSQHLTPQQQQPQLMGYSHIPHPSRSLAPASDTAGPYAYEIADATQAQLYYPQLLQSQLAAQYQTVTAAPAVVSPDSSAQIPTDTVK